VGHPADCQMPPHIAKHEKEPALSFPEQGASASRGSPKVIYAQEAQSWPQSCKRKLDCKQAQAAVSSQDMTTNTLLLDVHDVDPCSGVFANDVDCVGIFATPKGQRVSCLRRTFAFVRVAIHLVHIFVNVWMATNAPALDIWNSCKNLKTASQVWPCGARVLRILRFTTTWVMAPCVIYHVFKRWCEDLYFPMTASSSFHILWFGRKLDRTPVCIHCNTLLRMVALGVFHTPLPLLNFWELQTTYCPFGWPGHFFDGMSQATSDFDGVSNCMSSFNGMSATQQVVLKMKFVTYLLCLPWHVVQYVLILAFLVGVFTLGVGFLLLGVFTLGVGWVKCCHGFGRDAQILCCPVKPVYRVVAFFYHNT